MFDLDASKIIIVGVAALVFIPPKDLPRVLRQAGQFVGKMKRMANEFQGQFMDAMREADMADLRKEAQSLSDAARVDIGLNAVHDLGHNSGSEMRPLASQPAPEVVQRRAAILPGSSAMGTSFSPEPQAVAEAPAPARAEAAQKVAPEPQHTP